MNKQTMRFVLVLFAFSLSVSSVSTGWVAEETAKPPVAQKIPKTLTIHGHSRIDDYYWLNERTNPKVIEYLNQENAYTDAMLKHTEALQEKLYNEMIGRMKQTDMSVPYFDNGYWYYTRFEQQKNYPVNCRKKGTLKAREEILLNGNRMAEGHAYFSIGGWAVSPDNTILAYSVDTVSRRQYKIYFKNLKTDKPYPEEITVTSGQMVWAADNRTVFYSAIDDTLRPYKVFRHTLGTAPKGDLLIHHEADETFNAYLDRSRSKKYIFIISNSTLTNEWRYLEAANPTGQFQIFQPRTRGLEYSVDHLNGRFYILTNDQARNFRLMTCGEDRTVKENWKEVIAHREDVLLQNFELYKNFLVASERKSGLSQIRVMAWGDAEGYSLSFPDPAYVAFITATPEADTDLLRYAYTSMTTPSSVFEFNMKTKEQKLLKQQEVVGGYKPEEYRSERFFAFAFDGTRIPISLVYKKNLKRSDNNPLLLYGYGSYGATMEPTFGANLLSLLDRGFIYAIAHIRGGEEMGRYWYEEGKLFKKINTFIDFVACGETLVRHGYTCPAKMFAMGGSAGGLLMGAVANLQPDLFKGIIAAVPFVDVVTTMLDTSIPLTTSEYDEWGNPNRPDDYEYMLSYSPYDNVRPKAYPAMLVTTGLHDSQVQYWEPAKWVAKLRALKTDPNLLLLKTNMEAGHGGASGRFRRLKETALQYAFILDLLEITR